MMIVESLKDYSEPLIPFVASITLVITRIKFSPKKPKFPTIGYPEYSGLNATEIRDCKK